MKKKTLQKAAYTKVQFRKPRDETTANNKMNTS